jgi:AcrR family transcriptional regulator
MEGDGGTMTMTTTATMPRSTKEQIVFAAERLFAARGYEGVSLREIGAAAGSSNNSAVQYHFGSKEQLVVAIFENRLTYIDDRRALLIAQLEPDDIRGWVECYVVPLLEQGEMDGSHYMSFIAAVEHQVGIFEHLPERFWERTETFRDEVGALMTGVPEPLRSHRILQVVRFSVHAASARERAKAQGFDVLPFGVHVADLLDGWAGFLQAPASSAALSSIEGQMTKASRPSFMV